MTTYKPPTLFELVKQSLLACGVAYIWKAQNTVGMEQPQFLPALMVQGFTNKDGVFGYKVMMNTTDSAFFPVDRIQKIELDKMIWKELGLDLSWLDETTGS